MGIDDRRHVLIKDRFEDAVQDIVQTQDMVNKLAAKVNQE